MSTRILFILLSLFCLSCKSQNNDINSSNTDHNMTEKTFHSEKYQFSFDYPGTWALDANNPDAIRISSPNQKTGLLERVVFETTLIQKALLEPSLKLTLAQAIGDFKREGYFEILSKEYVEINGLNFGVLQGKATQLGISEGDIKENAQFFQFYLIEKPYAYMISAYFEEENKEDVAPVYQGIINSFEVVR